MNQEKLLEEYNANARALSTDFTAAQEKAAADFEDRDYYMFKSKNTALNPETNPKCLSTRFMGPGNAAPTVKSSDRLAADYHYPENYKKEGHMYPANLQDPPEGPKKPPRNFDALGEQDWAQNKSKNSLHLHGYHTKRPIVVPVTYKVNAQQPLPVQALFLVPDLIAESNRIIQHFFSENFV